MREDDSQRCMSSQRALQMHEDGWGGVGVFLARVELVEARSGGESGGVAECLEGVLGSRLQGTARAVLYHM